MNKKEYLTLSTDTKEEPYSHLPQQRIISETNLKQFQITLTRVNLEVIADKLKRREDFDFGGLGLDNLSLSGSGRVTLDDDLLTWRGDCGESV